MLQVYAFLTVFLWLSIQINYIIYTVRAIIKIFYFMCRGMAAVLTQRNLSAGNTYCKNS